GLTFEGMEQAIPLIHERLPFLADLLPPGSWALATQSRRTADRSARVVDEADALGLASGWPGRHVVQGLDAALGARPRVDLSEYADPSLPDLGVRTWDQPTRLESLVH